MAAGLLLKSICGSDPYAVVGVTIVTTLFSGLYFPYWMAAVYNASKIAPCTFRFQFASEGGWDAGGICASLVAALVCANNLPLWAVIVLGLPMVAVQALLVDASHGAHELARAD